jgi:hypothetical protein
MISFKTSSSLVPSLPQSVLYCTARCRTCALFFLLHLTPVSTRPTQQSVQDIQSPLHITVGRCFNFCVCAMLYIRFLLLRLTPPVHPVQDTAQFKTPPSLRQDSSVLVATVGLFCLMFAPARCRTCAFLLLPLDVISSKRTPTQTRHSVQDTLTTVGPLHFFALLNAVRSLFCCPT